jgi:hypothetical protein
VKYHVKVEFTNQKFVKMTTFYRLSIAECQEYSKYVYVNEQSPVLSMTAADDQSNKVSKCGIVETPLIVGGQRVNENEFPHMVNSE